MGTLTQSEKDNIALQITAIKAKLDVLNGQIQAGVRFTVIGLSVNIITDLAALSATIAVDVVD